MARGLTLVWLLVVWVALWERLSVANVLSGLAVAGGLLWLFPTGKVSDRTGRFHPVAAVQFLGYFLWKLLEANVVVGWEVITPSNEKVNEAIVAVPITGASDTVVTVVANAISLTPGTLTLEVRRDPTILYVHVLHLHSVEQVRLDVLRLERWALRTLGTDEAVAQCERHIAEQERMMQEASS
jgi:multicomponent Na+:H+ antiporter subunit E